MENEGDTIATADGNGHDNNGDGNFVCREGNAPDDYGSNDGVSAVADGYVNGGGGCAFSTDSDWAVDNASSNGTGAAGSGGAHNGEQPPVARAPADSDDSDGFVILKHLPDVRAPTILSYPRLAINMCWNNQTLR